MSDKPGDFMKSNPNYWKDIEDAQKELSDNRKPPTQKIDINKHFIDRTVRIEYPSPLISMGEKTLGQNIYPIPFATSGNFSAVQGGAKVGKTYFKSLLIASYIGGNSNTYAANIKSHRNEEKQIIDFDTEQGEWHVHSGAKRVDDMVGLIYENYFPYQLRELDVKERIEFIEHCLFIKYKNIGLVIIDGIADLVNDVNNPQESNALIQKLMSWSSELNIHILTFIHTNWDSDKATGHLGSSVGKKAETVCDLKRDKEYTNVKFMFCRGFGIEPFRFKLNEYGLPITEEEMPF